MKYFHFTSLSNTDAFSWFLFLAIVSGCFCLSSCEDDMAERSSSRISFTSEVCSSKNPSTRSVSGTDALRDTVMALQGGGAPLYLHTLYTDSITFPSPDSRRDTAVLTRATPIKNDNMYDSFGVSAYSYTDSWDESKTPDYFYNITASKSGSEYSLPFTYYWPGSSYKMKFFAYAPKNNENYVLSGNTHPGSPVIRVVIPNDVNDQEDLLVARTEEFNGNSNTAVPLTFNHALTAVKFVCGNNMQEGTVKSVTLKNVYSTGSYNMGLKTWSSLNTPATFSQSLNKIITGSANEALVTDAQTFMMVPQTLPDGAQIEILFIDNSNTEHILTADIKGTVWPMGKTVTYKVSTSSINWSYVLTVSSPADFTYKGGTKPYQITSYRQNSGGVQQAVPWSTQYSIDNGITWTSTKPVWLTNFTEFGPGGISARSYNATVSAQSGTEYNSHTIALMNATEKGTSTTPYNLSNSRGQIEVQNTANCYVVSAPGFYSFPLVYGNAIKNSTINTAAYTSTATGTTILKRFVNHTGNGITDPWISKNADCAPSRAELVWQDAMSLITDIQYVSGANGGRISFKVDKNHIRQGNAIVAIKDGNDNILWSWHIWVTDEEIGKTIEITNHQNERYKLMSVNLGWCDGNTTEFPERSCKVKIIAGDRSTEMIIRQTANSIVATAGENPYYQWGRKDPFLPSSGSSTNNKTWYNKDGISSTANPMIDRTRFEGPDRIRNFILKPDVILNPDGSNSYYYNLWSANNNEYVAGDNEVVKTVYDPCPVGFTLPAGNTFSGFTTTGQKVSSKSEINGIWVLNRGYKFYTDITKSKNIFFPASGWRSRANGKVYYTRGKGTSWSSVYDGHNGDALGMVFQSSFMDPSSADYFWAIGFAVRPAEE